MEFDKLFPPFHTMLSLIPPCVSNFRESFSNSGASLDLNCSTFIWSIGFGFFLIAAAAPMWLVFSSKKKKKTPVMEITEVAGDSPEAFDSEVPVIVEDDDSKYSLELQIQEVLLASLAPHMSNPSSLNQERILLDAELTEIENGDIQLQSFCEICLENKESWEMFRNDTCNHSFCYECISKHIVASIQENLKMIRCPGANCKATLDFDACRLMIPKDVLARWDEFLCVSSVPESQKLFCPFRDCSAMLIDDSGEVIREIKCPVCQRSFCARCRVPWHPDFTCKEFQKLNAKKEGKDESMFKSLAKKKNWQKCPSCKMHVEKSEGCIHITCRCGYEFCYRCGAKWSGSHTCKKS